MNLHKKTHVIINIGVYKILLRRIAPHLETTASCARTDMIENRKCKQSEWYKV